MRATLTRTIRFFALHRMWRADWPAERNRAEFGALADPPGHGHDYQCAVTVGGTLPPSGMLVDLAALDRILADEVASLDGRHLNRDVPAFADGRTLPTCEALAAWLYSRIAARLPAGVTLDQVRIAEDASLHADVLGPH